MTRTRNAPPLPIADTSEGGLLVRRARIQGSHRSDKFEKSCHRVSLFTDKVPCHRKYLFQKPRTKERHHARVKLWMMRNGDWQVVLTKYREASGSYHSMYEMYEAVLELVHPQVRSWRHGLEVDSLWIELHWWSYCVMDGTCGAWYTVLTLKISSLCKTLEPIEMMSTMNDAHCKDPGVGASLMWTAPTRLEHHFRHMACLMHKGLMENGRVTLQMKDGLGKG